MIVKTSALPELLSRVSASPSLLAAVKAVLVDDRQEPRASSNAPRFPAAAFAPYADKAYLWNPSGSGINRMYFPFPVHILFDGLAEVATRYATRNYDSNFQSSLYYASSQLTMQASGTSSECLPKGTCLPLGGHSVWGALPPLYTAGSKPIILVVASIDSADMFHDISMGANAPMSGLLAMLAAMQALAAANQFSTYQYNLVFLALTGGSEASQASV